ncbi:class I SAM-dependent methyltransferase [Saccharothrix sp. DSM 118769]
MEFGDGGSQVLPVARWHDDATGSGAAAGDAAAGDAANGDAVLLDACRGATIDLGCGPGRLVAALARRGVTVLGVDKSPLAVALTRARGGPALRRDVFGRLPGTGRWRHALLADGNIGIGGDPTALLRRTRRLLHRHGTVLVETEPPGCGLWRGPARINGGAWFPWARVDAQALTAAAEHAGLSPRRIVEQKNRCFVELERS